jgi:hypothetical protein
MAEDSTVAMVSAEEGSYTRGGGGYREGKSGMDGDTPALANKWTSCSEIRADELEGVVEGDLGKSASAMANSQTVKCTRS